MTSTSELLEQYGENPYGFFWVLQPDHPNRNLNLDHQRQLWKATLAEFDWFQRFLGNAELALITDNGDLVFETPTGIMLCHPRSDDVEEFKITLAEFLRRARDLGSRILPDDL